MKEHCRAHSARRRQARPSLDIPGSGRPLGSRLGVPHLENAQDNNLRAVKPPIVAPEPRTGGRVLLIERDRDAASFGSLSLVTYPGQRGFRRPTNGDGTRVGAKCPEPGWPLTRSRFFFISFRVPRVAIGLALGANRVPLDEGFSTVTRATAFRRPSAVLASPGTCDHRSDGRILEAQSHGRERVP